MKPAGAVAKTRRLRRPLPDALHPGAIWASFARQGRWKDVVLLLQCAVLALLLAVNLRLSLRPPDVVVVDGDGRGTYVRHGLAPDALSDFLREQQNVPSAATVRAFSRDFLTSALELNGAGAEASWTATLEKMSPSLRKRMDAQMRTGDILERAQRLRIWTRVGVTIVSVEPRGTSWVVRARVLRAMSVGVDEASSKRDAFDSELTLGRVRRSALNADGLEVLEWHVQSPMAATAAPMPLREGEPDAEPME